MNKKSSNSTGYRLHKDRILFSGGEIMRTIKYPLVVEKNNLNSEEIVEKIRQAIINDDRVIRSDINLNDYIEYTKKGNRLYTLIDFWQDCLRAGVIWQPSTSFLLYLINKLYSKPKAIELIENAKPDISRFFDVDKFSKCFILPGEIREGKILKTFKRELIEALKGEFKKGKKEKIKDEDDYLEKFVEKDARKLIREIADCFFSNDILVTHDLKEGKKEYQDRLWEEKFGIKKGKLLENFKLPDHLRNFKNISFFIIPELSDKSKNFDELIELRRKWLLERKICVREDGDYLENEKKLDEELRNLVGLSDNCNPLSNFLGTVFCELLVPNNLNEDNALEKFYDVFTIVEPKIAELNIKDQIMGSLEFLRLRAKQLGSPNLVNFSKSQNLKANESIKLDGWSLYRQNFGSKMQSWFTSYIERNKLLEDSLKNFKEKIKKAQNFIKNLKNISEEPQQEEEAQQEKEEIVELFEKIFSSLEKVNRENFEVFDSLLSSLRKRLNFFYQQYLYNEAKEGDDVKKHKILGPIFKNIEKPIAFYGETQRKKNEKIVKDTIPILEEGTVFLTTLISNLLDSFSPKQVFPDVRKKDETEEIIYRKELQFFWNKLKDLAVNSKEFEKEYQDIIESAVDESELSKLKELFVNKKKNGSKYNKYTFYKSKYTKGSIEEIKLKGSKEEYLLRFEKLIKSLTNFLTQFNRNKLLQDKDLLLDWVELAKNIVSVLIRFSTNTEFSLNEIKAQSQFKKAKNYLELFKLKKAKKKEFGFIIQSFILSEIKGAATLYSKRKYIASYSVQIVGSNNKFKLFYQPLDSSINISGGPKDFVTKKHKYLIVFQDLKNVKNKDATENRINLLRLNKERKIPLVAYKDDLVSKSLLLSSSPYQLQFLDKYLYRPRGWENIDIKLNEWSFVVEEAYDIEWDLNSKTPKLIPSPKSNRNKLYLAIPFTLKGNVKEPPLDKIVLKSETKKDHSRDKNRLNYPILGVDVGEYGVAWCLTKFDYNQDFSLRDIDIQGKGFIEDRNIGKIKDYFAEIQQKSRKGAYDEDDTTIAKVRENAIGKLRNAIHSILTGSLEGASPVYEDAISNFETGSGKTIKIYNSVKRADTEFKSEADKAEHSLVWGKKDRNQETKYIGRNVSAYASSYTCVNCLHTLFKVKKEDLSNIKILEKDGRIVTMSSPYGPDKKVRGYLSEKEKYEIGYQFKESEEDLKAFRKIVRDFARPPVNKNSEVLEKYAKEILAGNKIEEFRKKRGNSAIFVCPFCQFKADADIQAAFMMAMRGYLRFSGIVPSKENSKNNPQESEDKSLKNSKKQSETGDTFLTKTAEYLQQLRFEIKEKIKEAVKVDF